MIKTGIATASLFPRFFTEDAVKFLNENGVKTAEVFLESFAEYNKKFGKKLSKYKGDLDINSVHTLTTQFEPQLYSINERARIDSFELLEGMLKCAEKIGAKYYTFHGPARIKRTPININFEKTANTTQTIIDACAKHNIKLAYENVHWCYYNYIGYFKQLKERTNGLKATLDIKQARQSDVDYKDFVREMGSDIVTVHLSDVNEDGKMCLPGEGTFDFKELFLRLKDVGFNGALLIEAYSGDYGELKEIIDSYNFITELSTSIF